MNAIRSFKKQIDALQQERRIEIQVQKQEMQFQDDATQVIRQALYDAYTEGFKDGQAYAQKVFKEQLVQL
jgi:flagellar biosynthesis/type III secretory pathway protein FliH